jgi:hypothetical protein
MDIHQDTSFRSILEDDSISFASKARICFCLGKGVGLWLIAKPSICSFRTLYFHFNYVFSFQFDLTFDI